MIATAGSGQVSSFYLHLTGAVQTGDKQYGGSHGHPRPQWLRSPLTHGLTSCISDAIGYDKKISFSCHISSAAAAKVLCYKSRLILDQT